MRIYFIKKEIAQYPKMDKLERNLFYKVIMFDLQN